MSNFPPARTIIQTESVQTRRPVSELLMQGIAGNVNNYIERSREMYKFTINGQYFGSTNILGVDGLYIFDFDITITNIILYSNEPGTGGVTELDIKYGDSGGPFVSIFSTTPKAQPTHAPYSFVGVGGSATGLVAPVLGTTDIDSGKALRFDLLTSMTGNPDTCGLLMYYFKR